MTADEPTDEKPKPLASLRPLDQDQVPGYDVESVKLSSDPLTQRTLMQEYDKERKGHKLTKKALWSYAKKLYKNVTYVQTTAGRTVVDLSDTCKTDTNTRNNNKTTADQNNNCNNDGPVHQPMDAMTQIPDSKSQMLADPNALLGPLSQHEDVNGSQLCQRPDLSLLASNLEKEKVASGDPNNDNVEKGVEEQTEGLSTKTIAVENSPQEKILPNVAEPDAMIVDEDILHRHYMDQKEYGDVMGVASAGPKLPKKRGTKSSSIGPKKRIEKVGDNNSKNVSLLPSWSETQRAIEFLNEFYGEVDETGRIIPPTEEAIQKRINDVREWEAQANKPRYPPIERGDTEDEFEVPENDVSEDGRQRDADKEYLIIDDRYEEFEIEESATRFVAAELGLDEKCTDNYFSKCKTQSCIEELCGRKVDVYNKNHQVLATWTIIEKSLEDPVLAKERVKSFAANGVRGAKFNSPVFDFEQYFWDLWPGLLTQQLETLNARIDEHNRNVGPSCFGWKHVSECSMSEYKTFIAITIAATCYQQGGAPLWQSKAKGIVIPARFGRFMTLKRFKALRAHIPFIMSDADLESSTPWWMIDRYLCDFLQNRKRLVAATCWKVLDKLMSAFRPRTRKTGNLPHLSYLLRKPKPLGTEFKCCADTGTGIMLCMEVQEGKDPMSKAS